MALLRRVLLVGAVAVGAMSPAACSGDGDGGAPTPGAGAPVSADPPQSGRASVVAPSEPREPLLGDAVVVVDSAARVVYEFDLGRMRFRGPAPRVATLDGPVTLAGYPTLVSKETAQDAATVGPTVVVAGGREGTAVFLDRSKGDLAVADILQLPLRNVVADDTGKRSSNATAGKPNPYVTLVSRLGADDVLVVSKDRETGTSVGYALEVADRSLVNGVQLPGGGEAAAVQPYADGAVAAMSSRKLVLLTRELASAREIALPGVPTHLVVDGDVAWVSITKPARLVRVDL
ncbi:MAG TPA: hypothetical protein VFF24_15870, partial [Acidimicrobiia bacterium]|nr:hypothetical protein [Acidimicrobiia bacterium]